MQKEIKKGKSLDPYQFTKRLTCLRRGSRAGTNQEKEGGQAPKLPGMCEGKKNLRRKPGGKGGRGQMDLQKFYRGRSAAPQNYPMSDETRKRLGKRRPQRLRPNWGLAMLKQGGTQPGGKVPAESLWSRVFLSTGKGRGRRRRGAVSSSAKGPASF